MHLLVGINNNIHEWRDTITPSQDRPRLPIPYAFGGAFIKRGHKLSALNVSSSPSAEKSLYPFEAVYTMPALSKAMKSVDLVSLWGGLGLSAILRQFCLMPIRKRVVLNSYVWQLDSSPTLRSRKAAISARVSARFAKAVVVMTTEQAEAARRELSSRLPVILFRCGIDTSFYCIPSSIADVPETYRPLIERLIASPYMILPGDELRFNQDALDIVTKTGIPMVRISQYSSGNMQEMQAEIRRRGIEDRFIIFENISYAFMRFLLQHASLYAGLVNSAWQPAGWTVACEALASGLPSIIYEGLVSREMGRLGVKDDFIRSVPMNDTQAFQDAALKFMSLDGSRDAAINAKAFADKMLNLERTADHFVQEIERLSV